MCKATIMKHIRSTADTRRRTRIFRILLFSFVGLVLLTLVNEKNWRPLKNTSTWKARANSNPIGAEWAIDRNIDTRWSSHVTMSSGMYFQFDLNTLHTINGLVLHVGKDRGGQPHTWQLKISSDGTTWQPLTPERHVIHRTMLAIFFRPVQAQFIQIVQTSATPPRVAWVIHEADVLQPILPWQFSQSTMLALFIDWGIVGFITWLVFYRQMIPRLFSRRRLTQVTIFLLLLIIFLSGWTLRTAWLDQQDLAPEAISSLPLIDIEEPDHHIWLQEYFDRWPNASSARKRSSAP